MSFVCVCFSFPHTKFRYRRGLIQYVQAFLYRMFWKVIEYEKYITFG